MHFKCLVVVALMALCKQRLSRHHDESGKREWGGKRDEERGEKISLRNEWHSAQSKLQEYCISYWSILLKNVNWWLLPEEEMS